MWTTGQGGKLLKVIDENFDQIARRLKCHGEHKQQDWRLKTGPNGQPVDQGQNP